MKNYHLTRQIGHALRFGGLIDVSEFDFQLYDGNHRRIELGLLWLGRWMAFLSQI